MQAPASHLLFLGCPFGGLQESLRAKATAPAWNWLGDLRLTAAGSGAELHDLFSLSQEPPPADLIAALERCYPSPGIAARARLERFLSMRSSWTTKQLLTDLAARAAPARAVFLETDGCLRLETLERWLDTGIPLHIVHVVGSPETFTGRAREILQDRLYVAPDYRSHNGTFPTLEPQLAWYRIHRNIEIFLGALPPSAWSRVSSEALLNAARLDELPQTASAAMPGALHNERPADIAELAHRYGV